MGMHSSYYCVWEKGRGGGVEGKEGEGGGRREEKGEGGREELTRTSIICRRSKKRCRRLLERRVMAKRS